MRRREQAPPGPAPAAPVAAHAVDLASPAARLLLERFPELKALGLPLDAADSPRVLRALQALLPAIHPEARGAALRSALVPLRDESSSPALREAATRAIAISDLQDGIPDRSKMLRDDPVWGARWKEEARALEAAYGAPLVTADWSGAERSACVRWLFEEHPDFARGRDVLHIAPEPELQPFFKAMARSYVTLDATGGEGISVVADLCDTRLESERFDLVVCHRVLEHVVDDIGAMRELFRVLKPGGALQVSVPQSVHRPKTVEWLIPDRSQHDHVRQYGADFTRRLESVGFRVSVEDWLLRRSEEELRRHRAYPMRIYWASKP